ncbi:MAG TPA: hydroxyacid-oxoacid transhydrogenase [Planctomycetaceae bacterium]|nr:hydroxyacid-oxoacid transhydrogenase [Planctomycetaceae bacterium]
MPHDTVFQMTGSTVRYGFGATREVGYDFADLKAKRVLLVIDPVVRDLYPGVTAIESLRAANVDYAVYDNIRCEPTDTSFLDAIECATEGQFDAYLAVGGGSTIDTAKAANLYATYPAEFTEYVNPTLGKGTTPPGPLKPLIAVPTTAGTGSETTAVAVFDFEAENVKTGIANKYLRPMLGILDPENTRTVPKEVAASAGLDVLSHALESYTARNFLLRDKPDRPSLRMAYQGSNPISDMWALESLRLVAEYLPRVFDDPDDDEARGKMILASSYAGIGFGNAGVHLPHAMAYPVAGNVVNYLPPGYNADHAMVPHGTSVIVHTPAVCRFTAPSAPERHLTAAAALGADISGAIPEYAGEFLARRVIHFMKRMHQPGGIEYFGYEEKDIPMLVAGTLVQARLLKLSPIDAGEAELAELFRESFGLYV